MGVEPTADDRRQSGQDRQGGEDPTLEDLETVPEEFYAAQRADLDRDEIREVLPWWVETCPSDPSDPSCSTKGPRNVHFPAEGSSRDDVEKLCGAAVNQSLEDKDIAVYPPGYADLCDRCVARYRELANELLG